MINTNIVLYSALNGKTESQFILAENYFYGKNGEQNYSLAAYWYERAAKGGHHKAQYMFGYMLLRGMGIAADVQEANKYLNKAAKADNVYAVLQLAYNYYYGLGLERNDKKAFRLWQKGAKLNCPEAEYYLGLCYEKGIYVKRDVFRSKQHLYNALNGGFDMAKLNIRSLNRYSA